MPGVCININASEGAGFKAGTLTQFCALLVFILR